MKRLLAMGILLILVHFKGKAQSDTIQSRIILIGDAGELTKGQHPVVAAVRSHVTMDKKTTIIFLGDNLYKTGLPDESVANYDKIKAPLDSQLVIAKGTDAKVYFIPGNHDWNNGNKGGWDAIQREQYYINSLGDDNIKFFPEDGCPGPYEINITPDVVLLLMDSQWWVHPHDKPGVESDCPFKTEEEVLTQISDVLSKNSKKLVIFAFHHTLRSHGIHGGYFPLELLLFPLLDVSPKLYIPLPIGFAYILTRGVFGTSEDMHHPKYAHFIEKMNGVIKGHQNVIFASGHDHTLQLLKDTGAYFIVSGTGSKSNRVTKKKNTLFDSDLHGFAELEISKNKNVNVSFYTIDSGSIKKAYSNNIFNFSAPLEPNDSIRTEATVSFADSIVYKASDLYQKESGVKKFILGDNYRKEWSTPVKFKVFNILKQNGGFQIVSLGGGKQTKSLRLMDKDSTEWNLRGVDKDPEQELPEALRGSLAQRIAQDLISASNPYAALVIPGLAQATGVIQADPKYYYVPDDPAFGIYRKIFANHICLLEEREPTLDSSNTKRTAKVINKLMDNHDNHVDQQAYLRGRLLDMVIGDWDRHPDQWRWGKADTGKGKLYYPVPRDRDQAFFNSDGLLIKTTSKHLLPYLEGFKKTIRNVNTFNYQARDMDRLFMTTRDKKSWEMAIDTFQRNLTDEVIKNAVKRLPPEIYPLDAKKITETLIARRNILKAEGLKYYNFLSKRVKISGSNDDEYFSVKNSNDLLQVTVYKRKKNGDSAVLYNRYFDPKITKEISLYGLNGNDKFNINPGTNSKIKIRMIGGGGNDTFNIQGNVRNYIYDQSTQKNAILNSNRSKIQLSPDPLINEYKTTEFNYDQYRFPQLNVGYNAEDKLLLGIGFAATTYGFRKSPSSKQKLSSLYAPSSGAYELKYRGEFNKVFSKEDIVFNADLVNPTLNNFFGFGNNSVKDNSKPIEYYRVRYKYISADLLVRKRLFNDIVDISAGPSYYHYWNSYGDNKGRILGNPGSFGSDSISVYSTKDYYGGKLNLNINFVNSEFFPSRGITWYTQLSSMFGASGNSKNLTKITSDMTIYAAFSDERKLVFVARTGFGHIFNKGFEFFQALDLGADNYDRGYRKNRFSGSSLFYGSLEVRKKLFKSKSYLLPGDVGLIGFYDAGRVWMDNETSHSSHETFGGGVYYAPFNLVLISATLGFSNEDQLLNFSIGTKFNITF